MRQLRFLSTPSGWRATTVQLVTDTKLVFLSTPSGWRATPAFQLMIAAAKISIHALRVEGDPGGA